MCFLIMLLFLLRRPLLGHQPRRFNRAEIERARRRVVRRAEFRLSDHFVSNTPIHWRKLTSEVIAATIEAGHMQRQRFEQAVPYASDRFGRYQIVPPLVGA